MSGSYPVKSIKFHGFKIGDKVIYNGGCFSEINRDSIGTIIDFNVSINRARVEFKDKCGVSQTFYILIFNLLKAKPNFACVTDGMVRNYVYTEEEALEYLQNNSSKIKTMGNVMKVVCDTEPIPNPKLKVTYTDTTRNK